MYIEAPESISAAYINPSHQSVCLYEYSPIVVRQRLGKNISEATNTHAKAEYLLDAAFSLRSVSYQGRVCESVCVSPMLWGEGSRNTSPVELGAKYYSSGEGL